LFGPQGRLLLRQHSGLAAACRLLTTYRPYREAGLSQRAKNADTRDMISGSASSGAWP
jgi:hypothetical protein